MSNYFKAFFSVLLILSIPTILHCNTVNYDKSQLNDNKSTDVSEVLSSFLLSTNSYPILNSSNGDNFFRRLFRRNKTVAERNSQSQAHPTSRQQRYRAPQSNSQLPVGQSSNGSHTSSDNVGVQNAPKEPLSVSRRDEALGRQASRFNFGVAIGSAHAVTDIGNSKNMGFGDFLNYQTSNFGLNFGIYGQYFMNYWFALSFGMDYGSYQGTHMSDGGDYAGYRFENNIFEFYAKTEFHAPFLSRTPADIYLFTGVGVFFNDMRLFNADNRPESIATDYNQVQPAIPVGIGFGYTFNNIIRIGYELGYRYTMFNYFDGVSDLSENHDRYFSNALKISINF